MSKFIFLFSAVFLLCVGCQQAKISADSANDQPDRQVVAENKNAAPDNSAKSEKTNTNPTRISDANEAVFSPSGKFLAIQTTGKFFLIPTGKLNESIADWKKVEPRDGQFIGFLPSDVLIFKNGGEVFSLDAATLKSEKLFTGAAAKFFDGERVKQREMVIVSNDLLISGDGNYDWGGDKGSILKFDLRRKQFSRGAEIYAFWYASASPSGKYVLYEHGAEDNNNTDVYDVALDKNYPISEYFNFKKEFPEFETTDEVPILWIGANKFLAEVSSYNENTGEDVSWLALFDVSEKRIVWKKTLKNGFFPSGFHQLSADKALVNASEEGVNDTYTGATFEMSLTNGEMTKIPALDGYALAVSPDKKRVAFYQENQLFVASLNGADKKPVSTIPKDWKQQTAYKGMPARSPVWSPNGDWLILFGEKELLFVPL